MKLYPQTVKTPVKTHLLKRCKRLFVHQLVNLSNFSVLFCELNNNQGFSSPCSLETYSGTVWMVCAPKKLSRSPLPSALSFSPLSIGALNDAFTKSVAQRKAQPFGTHKTWKEIAWSYEWNVDFHTICFPKCGTIDTFFPLYLLGTVLFFSTAKTPVMFLMLSFWQMVTLECRAASPKAFRFSESPLTCLVCMHLYTYACGSVWNHMLQWVACLLNSLHGFSKTPDFAVSFIISVKVICCSKFI